MKKYISDYMKEIESLIKNKKVSKKDIDLLLVKIKFFQHERLIHLLVTLFYAIFCLVFFALGMISPIFFIIDIILLVFLIFYILHYFFLENSTQYFYKLYDEMIELEKKKGI